MQKTVADHPLSSVLNTALDAVIVMDSRGAIVDWNDIAVDVFGWRRTEAVGSQLSELIIPSKFREAHRRGLEAFLRTGEGPVLRKRIEVTALRKSGAEFPVELSITPYQSDGAPLFLGFLRDITDRKRIAEHLERQALQARILYETISFAAQASSFEDALQNCLAAVQTLTGWPLGHVYLPSDSYPPLLLPSNIWHPANHNTYEALKAVTAKTSFAVGEGLPGLVMQTGEPVWISDVGADARFLRKKAVEDLLITSALGFPVKSAGSTIAVIEFFTPTRSEPDHQLLLAVRSIGDQVGRVFERRLAETKLHRQSEHQKLLLAELNHRVKNMLTVVTGIAAQTMRNNDSMQDFNRSFLDRLDALSQAHTLVASKNWGATPLKDLIAQILAPYSDNSDQISIEGPSISLSPKTALALNLVLHELVTNAAKYGALSKPSGRLSILWSHADEDQNRLRLAWAETGLSIQARPTRSGFGTRLINAVVKGEMGGRLISKWEPGALEYDMELNLAPILHTGIQPKNPDRIS